MTTTPSDVPAHPYAEPRSIGDVIIWHTSDGWWTRRAEDVRWMPASSKLVKLAKEYAVVSDAIQARRPWKVYNINPREATT